MRALTLIVLAFLIGIAIARLGDHGVVPAPRKPVAEDAARERPITLVLVGDTGLNGDGDRVSPDGGNKYGRRIPWQEATSLIAREIDGDLNFANLETVVTDRNDLAAREKLFTFRMHPAGVEELTRVGFNMFSAANNHALDYGADGAGETVAHLSAVARTRPIAYAGLGLTRKAAAAPSLLDVHGHRFALSAIGISNGSDDGRARQLSYQSDRDFDEVVARLAGERADFRILSVHHGREFDVETPQAERRRLRDAAIGRNIGLVVGHHQHVVAGVEMVQGKLIFYGLGNFLHFGTQDMSAFDICRDYGLVARVHLLPDRWGQLQIRAVEALPVGATHIRTQRLAPDIARDRIHVVNYLAEALDDREDGAVGVRFAAQPDGRGLYCAPGAEHDSGEIGTLCRDAAPLTPPPGALRAKIAAACATTVARAVPVEDEPVVPVSASQLP